MRLARKCTCMCNSHHRCRGRRGAVGMALTRGVRYSDGARGHVMRWAAASLIMRLQGSAVRSMACTGADVKAAEDMWRWGAASGSGCALD